MTIKPQVSSRTPGITSSTYPTNDHPPHLVCLLLFLQYLKHDQLPEAQKKQWNYFNFPLQVILGEFFPWPPCPLPFSSLPPSASSLPSPGVSSHCRFPQLQSLHLHCIAFSPSLLPPHLSLLETTLGFQRWVHWWLHLTGKQAGCRTHFTKARLFRVFDAPHDICTCFIPQHLTSGKSKIYLNILNVYLSCLFPIK